MQVCASPTKPVHFCKEFQCLSVKEVSAIATSNFLDLEAGALLSDLAVFREGKAVPLYKGPSVPPLHHQEQIRDGLVPASKPCVAFGGLS